jgi:chromosomal replication initiator protein
MADQRHNTTILTPQTPGSAVVTVLAGRFRSEGIPGRITVRRVLDATAAHYRTTVADMLARTRKHPTVRRRQVAAYVARKMTGRSLPFIAAKFGGWDHTTILHHVRTVQARLDAGNAKTAAAVDAIVAQIKGGAND